MKQSSLFAIASCAVLLQCAFLSCSRATLDSSAFAPVVIYGRSINGNSPSGKYDNIDFRFDASSNSFYIQDIPHEFNYAAESEDKVDVLHVSALWGVLSKRASGAEAFAFERICERNQKLKDQLISYSEEINGTESIEEYRIPHVSFISAYVNGTPSITANGVLFGQPAGSDLSEWFRFEDYNIIAVFGTEYNMLKRADEVNTLLSPSEYFVMDKLIPYTIVIRLVEVPEEIKAEVPWGYGKHFEESELIRVNIQVPVLYERYWEWCEALYTNPDAHEVFEEGLIRIQIPFIRNQ